MTEQTNLSTEISDTPNRHYCRSLARNAARTALPIKPPLMSAAQTGRLSVLIAAISLPIARKGW